MSPEVFRFNGFYLIVLVEGEIAEVQNMFEVLWKLQILNVNVVHEDRTGKVLVKTYKPFSLNNCNDTTPIVINEYVDGKFVNDLENFFPQKLENLHNCQVRVAIVNNTKPFAFYQKTVERSYELSGRDIDLIKALSKKLNFKIDFTYVGEIGHFYENGTSIGVLKALYNGHADLSISNWWLKTNRLKFFDCTTSYVSDQIILVIPPGHRLTSIEKVINAFTLSAWILVTVSLFIGIAVIFIVSRQSKDVQNFVFGRGVKTSYLNLFVAFIGGTQNILPRRNFARFLLMTFLMYSLVVRTLYQASFFKFMKSNKHYGDVKSISEMIQKDYKFYTYQGYVDLLGGTEGIKNRCV